MLENIRFAKDEEGNHPKGTPSEKFKELSWQNICAGWFAVAHRQSASVSGWQSFTILCGLLLEEEIQG